MIPADLLDETLNIEFSRIERATRDRWAAMISTTPGIGPVEAEQLRGELAEPDEFELENAA